MTVSFAFIWQFVYGDGAEGIFMKKTVHLTPRQRQVLRLVANGLTNREIAGRFQISVRTVEVHRLQMMKKLKSNNVAQLIRSAIERGMLKVPGKKS